jgi:hypothetical protein
VKDACIFLHKSDTVAIAKNLVFALCLARPSDQFCPRHGTHQLPAGLCATKTDIYAFYAFYAWGFLS